MKHELQKRVDFVLLFLQKLVVISGWVQSFVTVKDIRELEECSKRESDCLLLMNEMIESIRKCDEIID